MTRFTYEKRRIASLVRGYVRSRAESGDASATRRRIERDSAMVTNVLLVIACVLITALVFA